MDKATMDKRAARFSLGSKSIENGGDIKGMSIAKTALVWNTTLNVEDRIPELVSDHIVGTCQDIEKQYLRLTSVCLK